MKNFLIFLILLSLSCSCASLSCNIICDTQECYYGCKELIKDINSIDEVIE